MATVENISISVKTNADKAATKLSSLADAMNSVKTAADSMASGTGDISVSISRSAKQATKDFEPLAKDMQETIANANKYEVLVHRAAKAQVDMDKAFEKGNEEGAWNARMRGINATAQAAKELEKEQERLSKVAPNPVPLDTREIIKAANDIDILKHKLEELKYAQKEAFEAGNTDKAWALQSQINSTARQLEKAESAANGAANGIENVSKAAKKSKSPLSNFFKSLKRIAFYRILRTIIKDVTQAFNEGLKNAYNFSKGIGGSLAATLDTLATKSLTMKNQMGAAFGALLQAIAPIILQIISLVTQLMQALSALFAAVGGGEYLVAKDVATAWDQATGAAKKYKNTILGFDEINRLDDQSGGGGGKLSNWADMFDEGVLPPWAQKIRDFLDSDLAAKLKLNFKDILLNWGKKLTGKQIAKKVITGLAALCGATAGFLIGGVPGAIVGTLIGASLGVLFSSFLFDNDGVLSKEEVLKLVCTAAGALAGGALGFVVGGVAGAAIGVLVGAGLGVTISTLIFGEEGEQKDKVLKKLIVAMSALAGGVIGFMVGGPLGAVIGATVGAGVSLEIVNAAFAGAGDRKEMLTRTVVSVLLALAGGAIGFAVGGPLGALIGVTIGASVSLVINNAAFADNGKSMQENILKSLIVVLGALVGGAIGFAIGGPLGAVIGAAIGIGVTLVATSIAWDQGSAEAIKNAGTKVNVSGFSHAPGKFAGSGWPDTGELFISREAGPELVGTINGNTAVVNNDDIVAAVSMGVANAVGGVMSSKDGKTEVHVYLDSREIKYGQSRLARAMGV